MNNIQGLQHNNLSMFSWLNNIRVLQYKAEQRSVIQYSNLYFRLWLNNMYRIIKYLKQFEFLTEQHSGTSVRQHACLAVQYWCFFTTAVCTSGWIRYSYFSTMNTMTTVTTLQCWLLAETSRYSRAMLWSCTKYSGTRCRYTAVQ
jgi:hypothetical protein